MENPRYLGDGLYAGYQHGSFILSAGSHDKPTDRVFLEPSVLSAFEQFVEHMKKEEEG